MTRTRPDPRETNRRMAAALEDLRDGCADLARLRCTILRVRAGRDLHRPVIVVAPPAGRARRGLEHGTKITTHDRITYAGRVGRCQVEWTERRAAA